MATAPPPKAPSSNPLIPEKYLDVPSQRLYYLSLGLLCQSIKILDFLWSFASGDDHFSTCRKWLLVDFVYCVLLSQLRIPRLQYSKASVALQISFLWFLNGIMFGGISVNGPGLFGSFSSRVSDISTTQGTTSLLDLLAPLTFGLIASSSASREAHLLGQHTVRMSPISTAHLNPQRLNFCLSPSDTFAPLPVVLNNTELAGLKYSITPLGGQGKVEMFDLSARDLKAVEQQYHKLQGAIQSGPPSRSNDEYDEYDDDYDEDPGSRKTHSTLQTTQTLFHLMVSKPGIVRLERVYDLSNNDARLSTSDAVIVPCPRVEFSDDDASAQQPIHCAGQDVDLQLKIKVYGVPPLSLRWLKTVNGNREQLLVEGIEGDHHNERQLDDSSSKLPKEAGAQPISRQISNAQDLTIPLGISLQQPGTYLYALEEVTDAMGNAIRVGTDIVPSEVDSISKTKTTRSFMVLRKPAVSFAYCSGDSPTSLLIGSEATLNIKSAEADPFDAPWDVFLHYQPPLDPNNKPTKKYKPWKKTLKTAGDRKDVALRVNSPGDYKIVGVKGKYCVGTIFAPDSCRVVEKPLPSADIEWKRIHECSGDTGVSASLILRGTPPFQIYYRMQRDNEPAREISKSFTSSRSELTLQPERSGHYVFTFIAISDANYRKVELQGPSIDQMIHPLASADFADSHGLGHSKRILSTCSGDTVDIAVDLRGTGPWNLEVQIIGPQSVETLQVQGIEAPRKSIQIPIPQDVKKTGGTFEIDLVSVEDASKCKRDISVRGITVNVKRVIPTVQFYGIKDERHALVTENENARLPLRLTGDGPWRIRYRRQESDDRIFTTTLHDPNDHLQVSDRGVYEILGVADSQCPGTVVADASIYEVHWISRPSAKLSPSTPVAYHGHNGSHILRPVCEGLNDHVDLDLAGRPPFQIMYNVAQNNEFGGTKIIDQPTFNSIQPRTRFQLHTSIPGRMYYEVKQIGDTAYPLSKNKDVIIPRSQRLLFEQEVSIRPSARFRNHNRMVYCLNDALIPLDLGTADGVITLDGTPPFTLTISIKNLAASHVDTETIQVPTNTWRLDLPSYTFRSIGPHLVTIESIMDSSTCAQAALDPLYRFIWVDVAETAAIIPFERQEDICVGEVTQFQLEGIPPWTIAYKINGKSYAQEAKTSPFSLPQQQPGLFTVTSIAHQQKMCKAAVTDLRFKIHALPSAQVGHGKKIFQDIHEGDQAEIMFTLVGEPPFTFTYQRSELSSKKGGAPKVLETHTVSRIMNHEYSIFSALEGTWTVTSISDKHCRYPPAQPDLVTEKNGK